MFFRFIFVSIIGYIIYRFLKSLFPKEMDKSSVHGKQKTMPLDFKNEDVEDAKFEEINDDKQPGD